MDDSDQIRRVLKRVLQDVCEIVGELSDGKPAAAEVEETQPEIVIMDMQMALVDGAESTRQIKAISPHVVVIGYTADPSGVDELRAAGADACFLKPGLRALEDYLCSLA